VLTAKGVPVEGRHDVGFRFARSDDARSGSEPRLVRELPRIQYWYFTSSLTINHPPGSTVRSSVPRTLISFANDGKVNATSKVLPLQIA
jgi:hypothetical protein